MINSKNLRKASGAISNMSSNISNTPPNDELNELKTLVAYISNKHSGVNIK
jgi:hypothetical protein